MHVSLVGVNHRTAPVTIREKLAIRAAKLSDSLLLLRRYVSQGIILSTCNRTEVYAVHGDGCHAEEASLNFLKVYLNVPDADLMQYAYVAGGKETVEHLFRIACGLNSMIVGEYEVLGQVGHALEVAEEAGMVSLPLRHVFQSAIRTGRRVREETEISKNALSISSVAVDLAVRVVGDLRSCKVLVIGAGEAGKIVAKVARDRGASQILVASRTKERASTLAATLGGLPIGLNNLAGELKTCNIVVTCADAPHWIVNVDHVEEVMQNRPKLPLVIIDIAVPRNVEPAVGQINNVFLYNIDDLTGISSLNLKQREGEVQKAAEIVTAEVNKLVDWWRALEVRPVVTALMSKAEDIRRAQLAGTLKKLRPLSDEERDSLEAMTKSIVTKILKGPVQRLKASANGNDDYAEVISELFHLNGEKRG
jgi:glutamyl-tRNA reductase